jgi:P-type Cu2+ transporter
LLPPQEINGRPNYNLGPIKFAAVMAVFWGIAGFDNIFELAGRLALASQHPVAAAVARAAKARTPLVGIEEVAGQGVRGCVDGSEVRLGRPSFCDADDLASYILSRDPEASVVAFRHGDERHVFAVRQRLRPDAASAVAALAQAGIAVEILSGDRETAVRHAAQSLGIHEWRGGVTPGDKIARVEELKGKGFRS